MFNTDPLTDVPLFSVLRVVCVGRTHLEDKRYTSPTDHPGPVTKTQTQACQHKHQHVNTNTSMSTQTPVCQHKHKHVRLMATNRLYETLAKGPSALQTDSAGKSGSAPNSRTVERGAGRRHRPLGLNQRRQAGAHLPEPAHCCSGPSVGASASCCTRQAYPGYACRHRRRC